MPNSAQAQIKTEKVKDHICKNCGKENTTIRSELWIFGGDFHRWDKVINSDYFFCTHCGIMFKFIAK